MNLSSPEAFMASALLMVASLTIDLILSLTLVKAWTLGNLGYTYYSQGPVCLKTRRKTSSISFGPKTRDARSIASFRIDHVLR